MAFAKDPYRVEVKSRLSTDLSPEERKIIYSSLLTECLNSLGTIKGGELHLACYPDSKSPFFKNFANGSDIKLIDQVGENLGSKMETCFRELLKHHEKVMIFGTDIPFLPVREIQSSLEKDFDVLIGPTYDGGYYAIGLNLNQFRPIFSDISWSTETVLARTKDNCDKLNLEVKYLPQVRDIDTFEDLLLIKAQLEESDSTAHTELKKALLEIDLSSKPTMQEFRK